MVLISSYAPPTHFALSKNTHGRITLNIGSFKLAELQSIFYAHKDKENLVLRLFVCEVEEHKDRSEYLIRWCAYCLPCKASVILNLDPEKLVRSTHMPATGQGWKKQLTRLYVPPAWYGLEPLKDALSNIYKAKVLWLTSDVNMSEFIRTRRAGNHSVYSREF